MFADGFVACLGGEKYFAIKHIFISSATRRVCRLQEKIRKYYILPFVVTRAMAEKSAGDLLSVFGFHKVLDISGICTGDKCVRVRILICNNCLYKYYIRLLVESGCFCFVFVLWGVVNARATT